MQSDILFDNIYIGHSVADADKLKAETYDVKHPIESAEEETNKPKPADTPKSPMDLKFMDDPITYIREKVQLFLTIAQRDPIEAIKFVPEVAGGIGVLVVTLLAVVIGAVGMSSPAVQEQSKKAAGKAKETAADVKDKVVDATSSGAEKVQAEVNKRTTRSSGSVE